MGPPQSGFHVENGSDEEMALGFAKPDEWHVGDNHAAGGCLSLLVSFNSPISNTCVTSTGAKCPMAAALCGLHAVLLLDYDPALLGPLAELKKYDA